MNEKNRLIRNTGIIAIGNLSNKVVSFLLLPLYTALLSTEEYGIIDYIYTLSAFIVPFVTLLMDEAIFRFLIDCKTKEDKAKVISCCTFIVCLGLIVLMIIGIPILNFFNYTYGFILLSYVVSSSISMMVSALLRGIGHTDQYAVFNYNDYVEIRIEEIDNFRFSDVLNIAQITTNLKIEWDEIKSLIP